MGFDYSKEPGKKLLERKLNTEGRPLVSIITPYYNAGTYFEQTYNCVLNQTFPWFEWIIVNDGSTKQEDVALLEEFAAKDNRIKVYHKVNGGISTARNRGIKESNTDIIIPLDADDLIEATYIELIYWGMYFNPDAAWCYTDSLGFGTQEYLWKKQFSSEYMKVNNILVCTAGIRKSAIEKAGYYLEGEKHFNEDWYMWLILLGQQEYPVHINNYGFWYRRNDTGVLSIVKNDKEIREKAQKLITEAASTVKGVVEAKEYPCAGKPNQFKKPVYSNFDRKVFQTHDKIHVMMLIPWMEMGGADLFNLNIVRKIDKEKFEMSILTTVPGESIWRQRFEEYVTDMFELPSFLEQENYAEFISYFIKSREIDVLFLTNSYYGYYLVPWLRKNFPDLVILDYVHMEEWYWRNGGYARTSGVMGNILEKTYVCNERTRQVLINDFNRQPDSVETLYIGVDTEKYDANNVEAGVVREQLQIVETRPVVLFPCRMHPQKRPFLMLEIARQVRKKISNIAFVAVGDGPQLEELQKVCKEKQLEQTVYFAGQAEDMLPYYKDADIALICSLKEGLALTAYESLSMEVPVVSSDVGGQKELIGDTVGRIIPLEQDEESDLDNREFSAHEVQAYVDAIVDILQDKERYMQLSKNCRNRIEEAFSSEIMIHKLEQIFSQAVQDKEQKEQRLEKQKQIIALGNWAEDYGTIYQEVENHAAVFSNQYDSGTKSELMRIASSKWGQRIIKVAFKLKLNRIFR